MAEVDGPQEDAVTRRLMAQVAHAKSSSFMALLDGTATSWTSPAALIGGGLDRSEWSADALTTPWSDGGLELAHAKSSSFIALLDATGTCSTSTRRR